MSSLSSLHYFPHLASGLQRNFDGEGRAGILFFNTVNFVKFISLLARNMNDRSAYLSVSLSK